MKLFTTALIMLITGVASASEEFTWSPLESLQGIEYGDTRDHVISVLGKSDSGSTIMQYLDRGYAIILDKNDFVKGFACGSGCDSERKLASNFRGVTDDGIRMNDPIEKVIKVYGDSGEKKLQEGGFTQLIYRRKGEWILVFIFDEKGLRSIQTGKSNKAVDPTPES